MKSRRDTQILALVATLATILGWSVLHSPTSAQAWSTWGCKSVALSSGLPHRYATTRGMTPWYAQTLDETAPYWWRAGVRGGFQRGVTNAWNQTYVSRASYVAGDLAWAVITGCGPDGLHNNSQELRLNARTLDGQPKYFVRNVIIHEFGHILGLGHAEYPCGVAVMASGIGTGSTCESPPPPWSDDMKGYRALYG